MLPPPTAGWIPNRSSTTNSPSITGTRQKRRPPMTFDIWNLSPK